MNRIAPAKLPGSKWTAVEPTNREKHFLVTDVVRDARNVIQKCTIEAVHSGREHTVDWRELKDDSRWLQGWR